MIFHGRLSDRNYGCRGRPRYLIFSQFSIYCCQNAFASGALPRTPPGGFQLPQLANVWSHHCRGPHRIAGPRAPRPQDPPLLLGGLSLLYTVYRLAGKYSEDDIEGSSQVSVPIMMSGFVVSRSKSSSGILFFIDWKFKLIIFSGRLTVLTFSICVISMVCS